MNWAILLSICALLVSFTNVVPYVIAAGEYAVTPLVIDLNVEKRDISKEMIILTNTTDRQVRIYPTVNAISADDGGSIETFIEPSSVDRSDTVTSWLEINRGRIELGPYETKEIPLTVRMNPQTEPGEYHAFIGFPSASNKPEAQKITLAGKAPGTIVRIAVDQERTEFLRLERFVIDRFITDKTKEVITYQLHNVGEAELVPRGEIIFYDPRGIEMSSIPINAEYIELAPGTQQEFVSTVPDTLSTGKYKAFLSLEYGNQQTASLTDTTFFYVLPIMQLLLIFGGILLFVVLLTVVMHRRSNQGGYDPDAPDEVALYRREGVSEAKDHDIDLSKK